jgi:hypothetical protein
MRLIGFSAIEYAEREGLTLNKAADAIDPGAAGLSVAEAAALADDRPDLIWLEVEDDEYYGQPLNFDPGGMSTRAPHRAGQRADELLPGQNSNSGPDRHGAGTAGGGLASGGLAGTNSGDGEPDEKLIDEALGSGEADNSGDRVADDEPQSGRTGGAVGGTPAGKRTSRR